MFRTNGGLLGVRRTPTVSAAPGVWSLVESVVLQRSTLWPGGNPIPALAPLLWYDFADVSSLTINGSNQITAVTDKGSRGWSLSSSPTPPAYTSSGINNLSSCNWGSAGHSNYLRNTSTTSTAIAEMYFVIDASFGTSFPTFNGLISGNGASTMQLTGSSGFAGFASSSTNGSWDAAYLNNGASNSFSSVLPTINNATLLRVKRLNDGTVSLTDGIQLGMDRGNTGRGWSGLMGEVVIFGTVLSTADRSLLQSFLAAKWGLTLA